MSRLIVFAYQSSQIEQSPFQPPAGFIEVPSNLVGAPTGGCLLMHILGSSCRVTRWMRNLRALRFGVRLLLHGRLWLRRLVRQMAVPFVGAHWLAPPHSARAL